MYSVLVLPGDGIGPEVIRCAIDVLEKAGKKYAVQFEWWEQQCGAEYYQKTGIAIQIKTQELLRKADAILLGAIGLPTVRRDDGSEVADEIVLDIRKELDLYANIRPIKKLPGNYGPLKGKEIDYYIIRENTEGLYASTSGGIILGDQVAVDNLVVTRRGVERITEKAFSIALQSAGCPRTGIKRVTCVDKANTLKSHIFFRKVFVDISKKYSHVETEFEYADAITVRMILNPETLNVIVCENMIGDIISDLGAATIGGMGLAPSANIGLHHGMFEPVHGSAPGIAGANNANPIAAILSGEMMVRWLGKTKKDSNMMDCADLIEKSVKKTMTEGIVTEDLGGDSSTSEVTDRILKNLDG
ncbi:isocitrate/isopropylmalate dehydrogenase family protein [Thermodesulfobacteriota bacterium]